LHGPYRRLVKLVGDRTGRKKNGRDEYQIEREKREINTCIVYIRLERRVREREEGEKKKDTGICEGDRELEAYKEKESERNTDRQTRGPGEGISKLRDRYMGRDR
jgi:hypothetical protein